MNPIFLSALKSVDEVEKDYNDLIKEKEAISKECLSLKQELELQKDKNIELIRVKETEASLQNKISNYQYEISCLHSGIVKLEGDLKGKDAQLESLQIEKELITQQLHEKVANLESQIKEEQNKTKANQEEHSVKLLRMKEIYEQKIASFEKEFQNITAKENDSSAKYSKIKGANEEFMTTIRDMKDQQKGIERQFREQMAYKIRQMEEERRKKESDMKALLESQKKMIMMEVRGHFEEKINKLEEIVKSYRDKEQQNYAVSSTISDKPESKKQLRVSFNESLNETSYFKNFSDDEVSLIEYEQNDNIKGAIDKCTPEITDTSHFKIRASPNPRGVPTMDVLDDFFDSFSKKSNIFKENKKSNGASNSEIFDLDYFSEKSKRPIGTPKASNAKNRLNNVKHQQNSVQKKTRLF